MPSARGGHCGDVRLSEQERRTAAAWQLQREAEAQARALKAAALEAQKRSMCAGFLCTGTVLLRAGCIIFPRSIPQAGPSSLMQWPSKWPHVWGAL